MFEEYYYNLEMKRKNKKMAIFCVLKWNAGYSYFFYAVIIVATARSPPLSLLNEQK